MTPEVLAVAETLNLCLPPAPDEQRVIDPRFAAFIGVRPGRQTNLVQRMRLMSAEVEPAVAEVRALFRAHGRNEITWEIGPSCTPPDLADRLAALGMTPDEEPLVAGMVLEQELVVAETAVVARPVTDLAGFREHMIILRRCFGGGAPDPTDEEVLADFERRRGREPRMRRWLGWLDGSAVAAADAILLDHAVVLVGGATLPEARGKGAYKALIAARFKEAVARGTPSLVVQAGSMSRPILERLGFETVATVRVLVDRFA
jgi:hypothetical protein